MIKKDVVTITIFPGMKHVQDTSKEKIAFFRSYGGYLQEHRKTDDASDIFVLGDAGPINDAATDLLETLEDEGYAERVPSDQGKTNRFKFTERGEKCVESLL